MSNTNLPSATHESVADLNDMDGSHAADDLGGDETLDLEDDADVLVDDDDELDDDVLDIEDDDDDLLDDDEDEDVLGDELDDER